MNLIFFEEKVTGGVMQVSEKYWARENSGKHFLEWGGQRSLTHVPEHL